MRSIHLFALTATALVSGIAFMEMGERLLTAGVFAALALVIGLLYRRFRHGPTDVSWIFAAVAAIALALGVLTLGSGLIHSAAVTAIAFREGEWVPLTILRFTTGAMLVFAGAMGVATHRAIRSGHRWAVGVGAATSLLFWVYLALLFPLPGTGGTVPPMLGLWTAYLVWLGAALVVPRSAAQPA